MKGSKNIFMHKMARTTVLAIFVALYLAGCTRSENNENTTEIAVQFVHEKPIAVSIPVSFFPESDVELQKLSIALAGAETSILGDFKKMQNGIRFTPIVPFRRNVSYVVYYNKTTISEFSIPGGSNLDAPYLINIYPTTDTLPENLLKIHLEFSEPMSELHSSNYVNLLNEKGDTLNHIFLKLDPELWNYDHTLLTLWLEPGRIKKSLLPNVFDGIPIEEGKHYTIAISGKWKSAKGVPLREPVYKQFYVSSRDENMPKISEWILDLPDNSLKKPLKISFNEVLDYTSILNSIIIRKPDGTEINGDYNILSGEVGIEFISDQEWSPGEYIIHVDGSVEDLAANNLNRLFDRDLEVDSTQIVESDQTIHFEIKHPINQ